MTKQKNSKSRGQTMHHAGRGADTWLRAVAISCVLLIHTLSSIQPSPFYADSGLWQWVVVGLDQLARISVPLFVALSGYGLWQKYGQTIGVTSVPSFLYRRLSKLLPAYVVWSCVFVVVFMRFPTWTTRETLPSFPWQLVWGRADYHLYFVPMIVQLYLLFPLFVWVQRRWPVALLAGALVTQILWYAYFSYGGHVPLDLVFFRGDSEQYLWSPNWVWYFVLGMQLPAVLPVLKQFVVRSSLAVTVVLLWAVLVWGAVTAINSGTDPLIALRFTRYEVMVYASVSVIALVSLVQQLKTVPKVVRWLGDGSYHLYLSHTLVLRVIFNLLLRK